MNILKTFEIFLREPLSILKDGLLQIMSIETENIFKQKPSIDVSVTKDKTQITVINNPKVYKLLTLVQHRAKTKEQKEKVYDKAN